jgi:RND family efflux transporter MFP subunit
MSSPKASLDDLRIERRPERARSLLPVVLAVIAILLLTGGGYWWWKSPRPIEVRVAAAREVPSTGGSGQRTVLNASGYVTARRSATVSSKVTGKVVEVLVEEGMKAKEGQILALLDDTNVKASLRLAEAQQDAARGALEETLARLHQAELEYRRIMELANNAIASRADLDLAEAEAKATRARLEQQQKEVIVAERQVASWQQQLEDTIIKAPFPGIVTSKNAQPGEMISPMSAGGFTRTGICTIVDMESLEIEIDVNESYINRVEAGQPVVATLDSYPDWKIPCRVIAIIPTADRQKSTVRVRVGFEKLDPRILPDMSAKVGFQEAVVEGTAATDSMVIVPRIAIQESDGRDVVFVVRNGKAERRAVTVGSASLDESAVSAGLTAGEQVVLEAPDEMADGARVKVIKP